MALQGTLHNTPISKRLLINTKLSEEESSKLIAKLRSNQEDNALVYTPDAQTLSGEDITYQSINDLLNRDGYKDDSKSVHRLAEQNRNKKLPRQQTMA